MSLTSNAGYGAEAANLAEQYESITFENVHCNVLDLMPPPPARVLDIGAGTGRDAAALAARGYTVVAAEPTAEFRAEARRRHSDVSFELIDDALPTLPVLSARGEVFDLVKLTAVWMHLDVDERAQAMATVARLVAPRGRLMLSLRHGPVPAGRRMFDIDNDETIVLAAREGLACCHQSRREDPHGRADVHWSWLAFERSA